MAESLIEMRRRMGPNRLENKPHLVEIFCGGGVRQKLCAAIVVAHVLKRATVVSIRLVECRPRSTIAGESSFFDVTLDYRRVLLEDVEPGGVEVKYGLHEFTPEEIWQMLNPPSLATGHVRSGELRKMKRTPPMPELVEQATKADREALQWMASKLERLDPLHDAEAILATEAYTPGVGPQ